MHDDVQPVALHSNEGAITVAAFSASLIYCKHIWICDCCMPNSELEENDDEY
jgi:hypothetical protein